MIVEGEFGVRLEDCFYMTEDGARFCSNGVSCLFFVWPGAIRRWGTSAVGISTAPGTINWGLGRAKAFSFRETARRKAPRGSVGDCQSPRAGRLAARQWTEREQHEPTSRGRWVLSRRQTSNCDVARERYSPTGLSTDQAGCRRSPPRKSIAYGHRFRGRMDHGTRLDASLKDPGVEVLKESMSYSLTEGMEGI